MFLQSRLSHNPATIPRLGLARWLLGFAVLRSTLHLRLTPLGEALDLTTPSGRALAGMRAVFAEFERNIIRDRVKATHTADLRRSLVTRLR